MPRVFVIRQNLEHIPTIFLTAGMPDKVITGDDLSEIRNRTNSTRSIVQGASRRHKQRCDWAAQVGQIARFLLEIKAGGFIMYLAEIRTSVITES